MAKVAYVTFKRMLYVDDIKGLDEDAIRSKAIETWNEEMELGDIMMDEDDIVDLRIEEE